MAEAAGARFAPDYRRSVAPAYQQVIADDPNPPPPLFREYAETDISCGAVPRAQYVSPDHARLEQERLWPRVWQLACREEQLPEAGDCIVYDSPGASLIVVRGEDGDIRAFYNSCLHRGMKLCTHDTSVMRLACPFHGFAWNLDGSLAHVPAKWDFPHVDEQGFRLPEARVGQWGGFVFVNRDPDAGSLESWLGRLPADFASWPRDSVYLAVSIRKTIAANWKTCIEGFLESFHLSGIHPQALPFGGDASTQYDVWPDEPNVSRFLEPTGVQSDQIAAVLSEQQILDSSLAVMFDGAGERPALPPGTKARHAMANAIRASISAADGQDYSGLSDAEAADAIQYSLFPNVVLFRSLGYPYAYRFLPVRDDPNSATFDFMIFRPKPAGGPIPETQHIRLGLDDSYAACGAFPPWLGEIYDQDAAGLAQCQAGLRDGGDADVIFSRYQEVRIRHMHQTLAHYIDNPGMGA